MAFDGGGSGKACIIGAGCSGFTMAKLLKDYGVPYDCFEMSDNIGGNWYYKNPNGMSSCYQGLHIDTSKWRLAFEDYPVPEDWPDFPHHSQLLQYFHDYVDHFGLRETITFNTSVVKAQRRSDGDWDVTLSTGETNTYQWLFVGNGHHWDPRTPDDYPGQDTFEGYQIHSHHYEDPFDPYDFRGKRVLYSTLLVPMMVVPAVAGYMFFMLFQSGGPVNELLSLFTSEPVRIAWLSDPDLALIAVMIADIWQWTPLMFLILLAGMISVPQDQQMAAILLGASWWRRFFTIVLPRMKSIIIIALAIRVIEIFKIFDTLFIMTGGGPGVATETISVYIYKVTQQDLIWSYVAAIALAILIVLSVVSVFAIKRMQRGADG